MSFPGDKSLGEELWGRRASAKYLQLHESASL